MIGILRRLRSCSGDVTEGLGPAPTPKAEGCEVKVRPGPSSASAARYVTETVKGAARVGRSRVVDALAQPANAVERRVGTAFERLGRRAQAFAEQILSVALFFGSIVSVYFIGLFASVGFEFFAVIDKQSMLSSIFLLTCLFTSVRVLVNVVPTLVRDLPARRSDDKPPTARERHRHGRLEFLGWIVAGAIFTMLFIGPELGVWFLVGATALMTVSRRATLKARLALALLAGLVLGMLRGEHLRSQEPTLLLRDRSGSERPVTVVMSADRGILVFEAGTASARFVTWDKIDSIVDGRVEFGIRSIVVSALSRRATAGSW